MTKTYHANTLSELIQVAQSFLEDFKAYKVFAFEGEMGAGKTTFISHLLKAMGVEDDVSSPTYGYVNEYFSAYYEKIYHFDLYRIESEEEAYDIGVEEYLYGSSYVFLEWAKKIYNLLPENCVWVKITVHEDHSRTFEVNYDGSRSD